MSHAAKPVIEDERIRLLNDKPTRPDHSFVLYWMQAAQRARHNPALEHAIKLANKAKKPLLVVFGLTENYPMANERHYAFMLEGLQDAQQLLSERGIEMLIRRESPELTATVFAEEACEVVTDMGYMNIQRQWRQHVAQHAPCRVTQVETEVVVPVEVVTNKEEYAARTIRPKIMKHLSRFAVALAEGTLRMPSVDQELGPRERLLDLSSIDDVLAALTIDRSVARTSSHLGGSTAAHKRLKAFCDVGLRHYEDERSEPAADHSSHMSPYLHFGHISPVEVVLAVRKCGFKKVDKFIEELVVRRELSMNFCHFNHAYDTYEGAIPQWARQTLECHRGDARPALYTLAQLEKGETYDIFWNAAQLQMVHTGYMHNYMRMYWGKKLIEWFADPAEAWRTLQMLNDKYELDGRDANSYTGVAWIFGKHDRPWGPERAVFGLIRYMNASGLKRKFNMDAYVKQVAKDAGHDILGTFDTSTLPRKSSVVKFPAAAAGGAEHPPTARAGRKKRPKAEPSESGEEEAAATTAPRTKKRRRTRRAACANAGSGDGSDEE